MAETQVVAAGLRTNVLDGVETVGFGIATDMREEYLISIGPPPSR
jgi:hypothetical protein